VIYVKKLFNYKDSLLESINKKRRRINAYFRQNSIRRIKALIFIISFSFSTILNVFAIENTNTLKGEYIIKYTKDPFMYIKYNGKMQPNYMYYYVLNGKEHPAYCMNRGLIGPEEKDNYCVDAQENVTDNKLKLIILNSYPYKTLKELNLSTVEQAKFASQFAIWCYTSNLDISLIEPISDLNNDIVECIKKIYYSKDGNIEDYDIDAKYNEEDSKIEKIKDKLYITKKVSFDCKNILEYNISAKDEDVIIEKENDGYKISIPLEKIKYNYNVYLDVDFNAKENLALIGSKRNENEQNMVLTLNTNFHSTSEYRCTFVVNTTDVTINKKDKDTGENIAGAIYNIEDENGINYGNFETDEDGNINLSIKYIGTDNIKIKEIKSKEGYILDENTYEYCLSSIPTYNINLYNEKEKGKIKIIKKSKEYNEKTNLPENTPLENVEFQVLDNNMNVIETITTDKYGQCITKSLPIGKYYIKETKTRPYYEKCEDIISVEIKENNEVKLVQILNNNSYIADKLPITGK